MLFGSLSFGNSLINITNLIVNLMQNATIWGTASHSSVHKCITKFNVNSIKKSIFRMCDLCMLLCHMLHDNNHWFNSHHGCVHQTSAAVLPFVSIQWFIGSLRNRDPDLSWYYLIHVATLCLHQINKIKINYHNFA